MRVDRVECAVRAALYDRAVAQLRGAAREAAVQDWPWRVKRMEVSAPETVLSKSQSAKTIIGDLPPSSSVTGISFTAAARAIDQPHTRVITKKARMAVTTMVPVTAMP